MSVDARDIVFFRLSPRDYDQSTRIMADHFVRRNPLCRAGGQRDLESYGEQLLVDIKKSLASGVSVGARDRASQTLAGICLNFPLDLDEADGMSNSGSDMCVVYRVMAMLSAGTQVFQEMKVRRVLDLFTLCVHQDYGGLGLGSKLIEKSLEAAIEEGYQVASIHATNSITAKICSRHGFHTVSSLDLTTVADQMGIDTDLIPGDTEVKMLIKELDSENSKPDPQSS